VDNTQNIISFCTGYGGLELGIRRAGVDLRVICNVEIEAFVQANLVAKIEEGRMDNAPIYSDLKTFPASIFRGKIFGVCGGYPCQPFSSAGKRKGEEDPRHLWPYIRKHIRAIRPVWCFFENVRGHTTMGLWRVLSDLEEDGYRTEWGLFSAEETGAPHQRIRCFILARLGNSDVRYEGSHGIECGVLPTQTEDRQASGLKRASDTRQVGNPASLRPRGGSENCEGEQSEVLGERLESDGELAHTASREPRQSQARNGGQDTSGGSEETQWPARPGEEQYEWEEPRVTEAQSELGGAVDGLTHRVDRLRLLGNGVVPQTAELAWKTLWRKMN
jgi:DNA (cytosine-5)-methyltransferase 1